MKFPSFTVASFRLKEAEEAEKKAKRAVARARANLRKAERFLTTWSSDQEEKAATKKKKPKAGERRSLEGLFKV